MHTLQVAPPRDVPDNDGPLVPGKLKKMGGEFFRVRPVAEDIGGLHGAAIEF
jgi:hypothetical protein